jgi:hypothetical protein
MTRKQYLFSGYFFYLRTQKYLERMAWAFPAIHVPAFAYIRLRKLRRMPALSGLKNKTIVYL